MDFILYWYKLIPMRNTDDVKNNFLFGEDTRNIMFQFTLIDQRNFVLCNCIIVNYKYLLNKNIVI